MVFNPPTDDLEDFPTLKERSAAQEGDRQNQGVTLTEMLAVEEGDAIAVRAVDDESTQSIIAGQVTPFVYSAPAIETIKQCAEALGFTSFLAFEADTWWRLSEGDWIDRSHELHDRPQMRKFIDSTPRDAPPCSLAYRDTGDIGLVIPMPAGNGSRIVHYEPGHYGRVVEFNYGAWVQPELLLPDGYSPP